MGAWLGEAVRRRPHHRDDGGRCPAGAAVALGTAQRTGGSLMIGLVISRRVAAIALLAALVTAASAGATSTPPVKVVSSCVDRPVKPREVAVACADGLDLVEKIHWQTWGGRTAHGTGVETAYDCDPNCPGKAHTWTVTVTAGARKHCGRSLRYKRLRVRATGPAASSGYDSVLTFRCKEPRF
jgi:hypothetical protein